ncbi:MAG: hypothetical protein FJZ01_28425 [Candidatus Sericytochromatia bacterium]|nr:hypothetical protein [Candidatus Tanganyikabacteria bacterium]
MRRLIAWAAVLVLALLACACQAGPFVGPVQTGGDVARSAAGGDATFGRVSIAMVLADPAERAVSALAGRIGSVRLQLSGRNVPSGTPALVVKREQFKDDKATVTIGDLLPGPIHLDVSLRDAADLVLGTASADATVSAGVTVPLTLKVNPQTGAAAVTIDAVALGEVQASPSASFSLEAVPPGSWAPGPPLTIARAGHAAGVVGGRLFAVSGDNHFSVETLDGPTGTWNPVLLPVTKELAITLAGAAVVRDQIVLLGGDAETRGGIFERIGPVYVDPYAGAGSQVRVVPFLTGILPEGDQAYWRTAAGVAAIGDLAYLAGGVSQRIDQSAAPGGNGYVHPAVTEVLDVARGVWFQRAAMPAPRAGLGLAALRGRLVAVGGYQWTGGVAGQTDLFQRLPYIDAAAGTVSATASVHVYDPARDSWAEAPGLAAPRHSLAVAVARDRVYAMGGADASGNVSAAVESWAIGESAWRAEPPLPTARALCAAATGPDGLIAVLGGIGGAGRPLRTVELFNPGGAP